MGHTVIKQASPAQALCSSAELYMTHEASHNDTGFLKQFNH
jgi:hypothetical protein